MKTIYTGIVIQAPDGCWTTDLKYDADQAAFVVSALTRMDCDFAEARSSAPLRPDQAIPCTQLLFLPSARNKIMCWETVRPSHFAVWSEPEETPK